MNSVTVNWLNREKHYKVVAVESNGEEVTYYVDSVLELAKLMGKLEKDDTA